MNGVLALSAYQVALENHCQRARRKAYQYQMLAIQDLRKCLSNFNRDHADGALVASMALLWLCEDMSSRTQISEGISAILQACHGLSHNSGFYHMIARAWRPAVDWHSTSRSYSASFNGLQHTIIEMQKFKALLKEQDPDDDDDNLSQLRSLIVLAQDLDKLDASVPIGEHFERIRLLRDYKLWLPLNGLLTGKNLPSTLMIESAKSTTKVYLKLEEATLEDVPVLTEVWFAAFTDPGMRRLWPDTPGVRKWWDDANRDDLLHKPFHRYVKVVDPETIDANGRPRIAAFAKWDTSMPAERGRRYPPWAEDMPSQVCDEFFAREEEERLRVMGEQKHYYLDTLATHPDYQRRGAGSMLMRWGCDLADKNGVAAYVDASKSGAPLYERFGFVDESKPNSGDVASMARR
ncbi:hypothetical protein FSARC_453 [Fusarium sarcochroum]|uniref:N-acetyltransferase domain-containing protein n=1 Tax=Fusarium sarcochroum TaxID=1208366 RepID=A0A8H4XGB7_9HYPO|nr:hypothetical protein FSARC_453 [Fusarium sarcochroum]